MEKQKGEKQNVKSTFLHTVSDKNKSMAVYNQHLLVERISPLGINWFLHTDEAYVLAILSDGKKRTPTAIVREIGKVFGRTCYKETVRKILYGWKNCLGYERINKYEYFWMEKTSPNGEKGST